MNNKSKEIQQEISNVIELFLDLDKNINKIKEEENQLKLSDNSKDIIQELLQSEKITKFFLHDEKIKKHRDSITIVDSVLNNNTNINDNKSRHKNIHILKKINPISFNQSCLLSNLFYYGTEAELYYIKRYIKSKILEIVKSCFEFKFNENKKEIFDKKNKTNLSPIDNKQKFILISSYNLKKMK